MYHNTREFIQHHVTRWTRRFLLGGATAASIAAMVVLGDNGLPQDDIEPGQVPWASPAAHYCQALILATPDDPEAVDATLAFEEDQDDDWGFLPPAEVANPNGKIMTQCQVHGRCVHNGVETSYTFDWCCFAGRGCYIKTGGAWISLAQWLRVGGGACVVQVGCK